VPRGWLPFTTFRLSPLDNRRPIDVMIRTVFGGLIAVVDGNETVEDDDTDEGLGAALMSGVSRRPQQSSVSSSPIVAHRPPSVLDSRRPAWLSSWRGGYRARQICCVPCTSGGGVSNEDDEDDWRDAVDRPDATSAMVAGNNRADKALPSATMTTQDDCVTPAVIARQPRIEDQLDDENDRRRALAAAAAAATAMAEIDDGDQSDPADAVEASQQLPCGVAGVGYRLGLRNVLSERRKRIADYSLVCAIFGLAVVVAETEMSMANVYDKVSFTF
jgi:hypothetical protein